MAQTHLLLTLSQALTAICLDFRGYEPQTMLFCEVLRALDAPGVKYRREPGKAGLWLSYGNQGKLRWLEGEALVDFMCRQIENANLDPEHLALICRMVFQTPCRVDRHPDTGQPGIVVQTDMAAFQCRQCGQCCRRLDYRDGMTEADVERLKKMGRNDILAWVRTTRTIRGDIAHRIWVIPGTNEFAPTCPFLKKGVSPQRWICSIHEVKPDICRHYPVSRKHALMTGCPGFDINAPRQPAPLGNPPNK